MLPFMQTDDLRGMEFNIPVSTISILLENNALLESLADLLIKTSAGNDHVLSQQLSDFFNQRLEANRKTAI